MAEQQMPGPGMFGWNELTTHDVDQAKAFYAAVGGWTFEDMPMPDGSGVVMLDGKMQDDATWKQARVMWDLAVMIAKSDPEMAAAYGIDPAAQ